MMRLHNVRTHCAISISIASVAVGAIATATAAPSVTVTPAVNHPTATANVSGSGFGANLAVDLYWDTTDVLVGVTDSSGALSKKSITVPADALPGTHWITAIERADGKAAQKAFTVRTDWASFGFGPKNKRFNPYENVISTKNVNLLEEAWEFPTNNSINSSPAVGGGVVYIGSLDGNLYALNAKTGAKKWSYATGGEIESSPAISGNVVYVGSDDGKLYAVTTSGTLKWVYTPSGVVAGAVASSPTIANGIVYIGLGANGLNAVDASTGALRCDTGGNVPSTPAVADGLMFWGDHNGYAYAAPPPCGSIAWSHSAGSAIAGPVTVTNGDVFFETYSNGQQGYTTYGNSLGTFAGSTLPIPGAAAAYGSVYVGTQDSPSHCLCSVSLTPNGSQIGYNPGAAVTSSPAVANGIVYVGDVDGRLHAVDADTGKGLWTGRTNNSLFSSPAVSDGMVFVGSYDGRVYAYALNGGDNAAYHRDGKPPSFTSLHPNYRLKATR